MKIQCKNCEYISNISEEPLEKKIICSRCFYTVEISKENEFLETPEEFALRLQKKGLSSSEIQKKMILSALEHHKVEHILRNLKQSLSLEEQKNFGEVISWTSRQNAQIKKTNPLSLQPRNFTFSLKDLLIMGICLCGLSFICVHFFWLFWLFFLSFVVLIKIFSSILAIPLIIVIIVITFILRYFVSSYSSPEKNYNITVFLTLSSYLIYFFLYFLLDIDNGNRINRIFRSSDLLSLSNLFFVFFICIFLVVHILSLLCASKCSNLTFWGTFFIYGSNIFLPLVFLPFFFFIGFLGF